VARDLIFLYGIFTLHNGEGWFFLPVGYRAGITTQFAVIASEMENNNMATARFIVAADEDERS
jgi:hypothetical protein